MGSSSESICEPRSAGLQWSCCRGLLSQRLCSDFAGRAITTGGAAADPGAPLISGRRLVLVVVDDVFAATDVVDLFRNKSSITRCGTAAETTYERVDGIATAGRLPVVVVVVAAVVGRSHVAVEARRFAMSAAGRIVPRVVVKRGREQEKKKPALSSKFPSFKTKNWYEYYNI